HSLDVSPWLAGSRSGVAALGYRRSPSRAPAYPPDQKWAVCCPSLTRSRTSGATTVTPTVSWYALPVCLGTGWATDRTSGAPYCSAGWEGRWADVSDSSAYAPACLWILPGQ